MSEEEVAATIPDSGTSEAPLAVPPEPVQTILGSEEVKEEVKPEGDEQTDNKDAKPESVIPEKYELKLPEGMALDEAALEAFTPIAKELGLDQEKAQKLADVYAGIKAKEAAQAQEAWVKDVANWRKEVETDKVLGGQAFEGNKRAALAALKAYAPPELQPLLEQSGLGNHKAIFAFCAAVGKAMSEDKFEKGAPAGDQGLAGLYPTMHHT